MKNREYASSSQKMAGNEQIVAEVARIRTGLVTTVWPTSRAGVKVIAIDGATPSVAAVQAKQYPLSRPTYYYTNGDPTGPAKAFVDFTLGPAGQKIAQQVGFIPVK